MRIGVLSRYFGLHFAKTVFSVFAGVFFLIFTIDLVETLRRSGEAQGTNAGLVAWLSFLHTPIVAEQALPFVVLLGSMMAFLSLSRRLELVVARAAGLAVSGPGALDRSGNWACRIHLLQPVINGDEAPVRGLRSQTIRFFP